MKSKSYWIFVLWKMDCSALNIWSVTMKFGYVVEQNLGFQSVLSNLLYVTQLQSTDVSNFGNVTTEI